MGVMTGRVIPVVARPMSLRSRGLEPPKGNGFGNQTRQQNRFLGLVECEILSVGHQVVRISAICFRSDFINLLANTISEGQLAS
jgi:hypothetical protein